MFWGKRYPTRDSGVQPGLKTNELTNKNDLEIKVNVCQPTKSVCNQLIEHNSMVRGS